MYTRLQHFADAVYKRAVEESPREPELPGWTFWVFLADFIVFLPVILWTTYTLHQVYPIFAIVEDENPPAYDPVNLAEDEGAIPSAGPEVRPDGPIPQTKVTGGRPTTVTSSIRSINRLLTTYGGWRANFRGIGVYLVQALATNFLFGIFSSFLPNILASLATLLSALALVQLSAVWVHIVITPSSSDYFWKRLPPFKRTFDATAKPVAAYWLAEQVATWVPIAVGWALGLDLPNFQFGKPNSVVSQPQSSDAWKSIVITLISIAFQIIIVIPAHVVLVRVQASLIPEEANTIIPFDRSFEGKVEPRVVGGKGYATMDDAWSGFSRNAWKRLVILYVKIFAVSFATFALMAAVVIPEIIVFSKLAK
ncbi:ubiquitin carrier protein [Colletotrichum salicis]|uniref:Ubiquitin carrier protein n=1 Tax=Colletotrichum salicis TaxID=1209931 RepID=A0A135V1B7_9PEZI|nr:ubiquitin carrier protein [Colletotrichum salicis]